jgi:alanyl-tRNA synthetase
MGPTGPCGPCSEIYYDLGAEFASGHDDVVGGDGDRFIEIWNLVFTGFDRQADGTLKPLDRPCIDTGMGLERLAFCAQNVKSPFHTDLFWPIVEQASARLKTDPFNPKYALGYRVIADHVRAATMLASEGIIPSNVERGYVLRRLVRRAARYGQLMGYDKPFLSELVPSVISIFAPGYPELTSATSQVQAVLKTEESKFLETLHAGEAELNRMLEKSGNTLSGEQAFRLYETFGFPLELVQEILSPKGVRIDEAGFKSAQDKASDVARASWRGSGEKNLAAIVAATTKTQFLGYDVLESRAHVLASAPGLVALDQTPFYAEGGGQVADTGDLIANDGITILARVVDVQKQNNVFVHILDNKDALPVGTSVITRVDGQRRNRIVAHHTATHLMNEALKRVLGSHIRQAGSYVGPDKLRFDFTHPKPLSPEEITRIESLVNSEVRASHPVAAQCYPVSKVAELGATTLLGEDYGDTPRFLLIGEKGWVDPKNRFSLELCGGTHVSNTDQIGAFKIIREASASAGVRRIEAIAGKALEEFMLAQDQARKQAASELKARQADLLAQIKDLGGDASASASNADSEIKLHLRQLENILSSLKANRLAAQASDGKKMIDIKGIRLCVQRLDGADPKSLRGLSDKLKAEVGSGLIFLAAPGAGKLSFVLAATQDLAAKGMDAAKIAKAFASANGGSAGGRADFAQGGAADSDWEKTVESLTANI